MSNVPLQQQNFDKSAFAIKVDTFPADYAPGDLVRGYIYLRLLGEAPIQSLEIRFHGEMMCPAKGTAPGQTPQQRDTVVLFDSLIFLLGRPPSSSQNNDITLLRQGNHNFPFQFQFPTNGFIPSSFRMAEFNSHIEYKLIARLSYANIPKVDDVVDVRVLQVRERIDVSLVPVCNPLTHNAMSDNKNSQASLTVPHIGFVPGEVIQIDLTYSTNEHISVPHTLRLSLEQQAKGVDNKIFRTLIRTTNIPFTVNAALSRASASLAVPDDLTPPTILNHKYPSTKQRLSVMYVLVATVERTIDKNSKTKGIFRKSQQLVIEPVLRLAVEIVVGTRRGAPQQSHIPNAPFPMRPGPPPQYFPPHNRPPPQSFYPPAQPLPPNQTSYPPHNQYNPSYGAPPQNLYGPTVYGPPGAYPPQPGYPPENRRPPPENMRFPPDQRTPPLGPERSRAPSPTQDTKYQEEIVLEPVTATNIPPPVQRKYSFDAEDFVFRTGGSMGGA